MRTQSSEDQALKAAAAFAGRHTLQGTPGRHTLQLHSRGGEKRRERGKERLESVGGKEGTRAGGGACHMPHVHAIGREVQVTH